MRGGARAGACSLALSALCLAAAPFVFGEEEIPPPRVLFLDPAAAAEAIVDDSRQPYFSRLQPMEIAAKTGRPLPRGTLERQRAECRQRYREAVLGFTAAEMTEVLRAVEEIHPFLFRNYPRVTRDGWSFVKLDSHIEGGMPHTRGDRIVLSPRLLRLALDGRRKTGEAGISGLVGVLLSEQVHVLQRRDPELFRELYEKVWGFRRARAIPDHPWLLEHQAVNPDGTDGPWVFPVRSGNETTWIWPTAVIGESRGVRRLLGVPSLARDLQLLAVELVPAGDGFALRLEESGMPVVRRLISYRDYRREFPAVVAPFHPNKIAAESFARIVLPHILGTAGDRTDTDPRLETLDQWFREKFR